MTDAGSPALNAEEVPIAKAIGRVLAEALTPGDPLAGTLAKGTRLNARHAPQLAAAGRPSVRVFQKLKVGVLTLADSADPPADDDPGRSTPNLVGPTLAAGLESLGAAAIAAPRVHGDATAVCSVLDMLLNECAVVLVAGNASASRQQQLHQALSARGASPVDWMLCDELGARLSVATVRDKVVVCMPRGLAESFMAFVLLVSPLIRRLQGRSHLLPARRTATVQRADAPGPFCEQFLWAHESGTRSDLSVRPLSACPIDAISHSDGIVHCMPVTSSEERRELQYFAYASWLQ